MPPDDPKLPESGLVRHIPEARPRPPHGPAKGTPPPASRYVDQTRLCKRCGASYVPYSGQPHQSFCSGTCKAQWWSQARNRGGQAYRLLIEWRLRRGKTKTIGDLSAMVDEWIREDRDHVRPD